MPPTATHPSPAPPRRIGRRLLGSGLLEALAAPHGVDRYLELLRPAWTLAEPRARVVRVERQTPDSTTLSLRANGAWQGFQPGQFVNLAVEIDGVRRTRCYSPASSSGGGGRLLELTVKAHPGGLVSQFLHERAHPGMTVGLSLAQGDFALPGTRPASLLLISGGSGITPVMSMLRTLCDEGHRGPISFIHYAPTPELALYDDELERIARAHPNIRVARSYTREPDEGELDGYFSRRHLLAAASDYPNSETFACGPPALLDAVRALWAEEGLEERLHIESFLPPSLAIETDEAEGTIRFAGSGQEATNDGRTLLEQAEAAGLRPEFGCRMGICHSCTRRKDAGCVRNVITGDVSSTEEEDVQLCVSVPVGDVSLDL